MKKQRFFYAALGIAVLLAGCSKAEEKEEKSHSTKQTEKQQSTKEKKETSADKTDKEVSKEEATQKPIDEEKTESGPLTDAEIKKEVAMMLLSPKLKKQFINGRQLMEGQYPGVWGKEQGKPYEVILEANEYRLSNGRPLPPIYGGPEGMRYFEASPPSGSFVTIVGVSREYVCIIGTQGAMVNYEEEMNSGLSQQFRVQDLKQSITNQAEINQVMNKITLGNNEFLKPKRIDE